MLSYFPPKPFRGRFIRRTVGVWLFVRVVSVMGGSSMVNLFADLEGGPRPATVSVGSLSIAVTVAGLVVLLIMGDMIRRSELMFLANLGLSARQLIAAALIICVLLEAALQIALVG